MEGVENIIDIIKNKTAAQAQKVVSEAEAYKKERLKRAQEKADSIVEAASNKADRQAHTEMSKYTASAILKQKYRVLNTKEGIMKEVIDSAWDATTKRAGKADYKEILTRLAIQGGVALNVDEMEILLPDRIKTTPDVDQVAKAIGEKTGNKHKVTVSDERVRASGGLVVRAKDGTKWVDNTFEARQGRLENNIRDIIASVLFGTEEKT